MSTEDMKQIENPLTFQELLIILQCCKYRLSWSQKYAPDSTYTKEIETVCKKIVYQLNIATIE